MRADRDVLLFVIGAILASAVLGALLWFLRLPSDVYWLGNGLFLVPTLSVIAAARGADWLRKAQYLAITFGGFALIDYLAQIGIEASQGTVYLTPTSPTATVLMIAYKTFATAYPIVVLIFFVGSRPNMLWAKELG